MGKIADQSQYFLAPRMNDIPAVKNENREIIWAKQTLFSNIQSAMSILFRFLWNDMIRTKGLAVLLEEEHYSESVSRRESLIV